MSHWPAGPRSPVSGSASQAHLGRPLQQDITYPGAGGASIARVSLEALGERDRSYPTGGQAGEMARRALTPLTLHPLRGAGPALCWALAMSPMPVDWGMALPPGSVPARQGWPHTRPRWWGGSSGVAWPQASSSSSSSWPPTTGLVLPQHRPQHMGLHGDTRKPSCPVGRRHLGLGPHAGAFSTLRFSSRCDRVGSSRIQQKGHGFRVLFPSY